MTAAQLSRILLLALAVFATAAASPAAAGLVSVCADLFPGSEVTSFATQKSALPATLNSEIASVVRDGHQALKDWQAKPFPHQADSFHALRVIKTTDLEFPFELHEDAKRLFRMRSVLGEGKHGIVFLTEAGRALKILKHLDSPRELALQVYSNAIWAKEGIRVPQIFEFDPKGNWIVQEAVPGKSIYDLLGTNDGTRLNKTLARSLENVHLAALRIAKNHGLFFDLKAANFVMDGSEQITFVDVAPRLDSFRYIYTQLADGRALSRELFREQFLFRQIRDEELTAALHQTLDQMRTLNAEERVAWIRERFELPGLERRHLSQTFSIDNSNPHFTEALSAWTTLRNSHNLASVSEINSARQAIERITRIAEVNFAAEPNIRNFDVLTFLRYTSQSNDPAVLVQAVKELRLKFFIITSS